MSAIPDPEGIVALTEEEIGEQFNVETFTNLLKTSVFGRRLFHYPSIPSTQVYMYQYPFTFHRAKHIRLTLPLMLAICNLFNSRTNPRNVSKFPEGSCVLADVQTSGRGM